MMCFIDQDELEFCRVEFGQSICRYDALNASYRYICMSRGMYVAHLNIDALGRICVATMSGGLFDKLLAMSENEGLCSLSGSMFDAINEMSEDNLTYINMDVIKWMAIDLCLPTVFPAPVARDTPSRFFPWSTCDTTA